MSRADFLCLIVFVLLKSSFFLLFLFHSHDDNNKDQKPCGPSGESQNFRELPLLRFINCSSPVFRTNGEYQIASVHCGGYLFPGSVCSAYQSLCILSVYAIGDCQVNYRLSGAAEVGKGPDLLNIVLLRDVFKGQKIYGFLFSKIALCQKHRKNG